MGLNFYELLPFWYTFFQTLDFNVVVSRIPAGRCMLPASTPSLLTQPAIPPS